jgi:hypothetical protein
MEIHGPLLARMEIFGLPIALEVEGRFLKVRPGFSKYLSGGSWRRK